MRKILVVLSGGQDSTTCLYLTKHQHIDEEAGDELHAVTFDYGQRHSREIACAAKIAKMAGVTSHEIVTLGEGILRGTSPLVSGAKLEQYADHNSLPGGLEKTFVPMRNQLFLTVAANRAYVLGCDILVTGVSEEDYGGYPDCRRPFLDAVIAACNRGTFTGEPGTRPGLRISAPLLHMSKRDEVNLSLTLPGCYGALAWSHTAYDGEYPPTGHDHATLLRAKGFEQAMIPDPLVLRAYNEWKMPLPPTDNYAAELVRSFMKRLHLEGGL